MTKAIAKKSSVWTKTLYIKVTWPSNLEIWYRIKRYAKTPEFDAPYDHIVTMSKGMKKKSPEFEAAYDPILVMSPSWAGSSHSSSWRFFSLAARDLFHFSSELEIDWKTSWNFNFQLKTYFLLFSIIKLPKLCIWIKSFTFKTQKFR